MALKYKDNLHDTAILERDERGRRSATRLITAQHEIEVLRRDLRQQNASRSQSVMENSEMEATVAALKDREHIQRQKLELQLEEIATLQVRHRYGVWRWPNETDS